MKIIRFILRLIVSLLLACIILAACVSFFAARTLEKEELPALIKDADVGAQIMGYEYLDEIKENDFYSHIRNILPAQVALVADVLEDGAEICQEAAIQHLREMGIHNFAFSNMKFVTNEIVSAYVDAAIEKNIISPNRKIYYTTMYGRTSAKQDSLLRETISTKYQDALNKLAEEDRFTSLNIDQKNTFAYLLRTGKDKREIQNGLYRHLEERFEKIYADRFIGLIENLKNGTSVSDRLDPETFEADTMEAVYGYLASNGVSFELLDTNKSDQILANSIRKEIYPKLSSYLPSYEDTFRTLPSVVLSAIRLFLNNTVTYALTGIAALLALIFLLAGRKKAIGFIGLSFLLTGIAMVLFRFVPERYSDTISENLANAGNRIYIIVPALLRSFSERLSVPGIIMAAAGLLLIVLALLINRNKATKQ